MDPEQHNGHTNAPHSPSWTLSNTVHTQTHLYPPHEAHSNNVHIQVPFIAPHEPLTNTVNTQLSLTPSHIIRKSTQDQAH
jgi:hypothetical protein